MTLGAVCASPPEAQRALWQASGEWAIRTIGQKPKEPNCSNWDPDWPEIQKRLGGTSNCLPFLPDTRPTQCYILPPLGWVLQGRLPTLLCVPL